MATTLDAISPAPLTQPAAGVALICDCATTPSRLAAGPDLGTSEAEIYGGIAAAILRHSGFSVVLHARSRPTASAFAAAIERSTAQLPNTADRLRLIEAAPLTTVIPGVDLLVSFASPALIEGCRNGLKPVQIGRAVVGSAAFSHVFPDIAGFAAALAMGIPTGRLSLAEYAEFEAFCRGVAERSDIPGRPPGGNGPVSARRLARDPIVRECRQSKGTWHAGMRSFAQGIGSAAANPFAAWRVFRARFGSTDTG